MGKGGDYLKKFMPAHRPYRNIHFCHDWYPTIFSMLTPETIFHYSTSNVNLVSKGILARYRVEVPPWAVPYERTFSRYGCSACNL
jgi:hypothetical protein